MSLFQAKQQWSRMSSSDLKTRCAAKQRQSSGEAKLERTWQTSQKLFAMVNHIDADSGIGPVSQTLRDLV
jgi:hypothetical protein